MVCFDYICFFLCIGLKNDLLISATEHHKNLASTAATNSIATNSISDEELASLRREINYLKENTVSKETYNDLKQELLQLKDSLNGLKVRYF